MLAQNTGYENRAQMLYQMYVIDRVPIERIAHILVTPMWSLRKQFDEFQIEVRTRGGRNNVKVEVTEELVAEASRDGVPTVAARIGVDPVTLGLRLKRWHEERKKEL